MEPAIRIENLSKQYRLGLVGTGTLSHDLKRWWHLLRGKEDPYLKIGETNDRATKGNSQYVWALKDINLEVMPGEVLGIIGKNGAGKSTLLKILSKVTGPTTGKIDYKGRIGSLLEVGTGFHPELTGRENIYLNGAILGMRKKEIDRKFDEIVDFSGVERYIDTPTKRYSSGMTVRLGFAVAAFLEPEILVVDEVLAVGDAEFQKKAIGKMQDVSKNDGRTVLFVSHNMAAVKQLCNSGILLEQGKIVFQGKQEDAVNKYLNHSQDHLQKLETIYNENENVSIKEFIVTQDKGNIMSISSGIKFELQFLNKKSNKNLAVTFELRNIEDTIIFHQGKWICSKNDSENGIYTIKGKIPASTLNSGIYIFNLLIAESLHNIIYSNSKIAYFEIQNEVHAKNLTQLPGVLRLNLNFQTFFEGKPIYYLE